MRVSPSGPAPTTIPQVIDLAAERFPAVEALVEEGLRLTFPQLAAAVDGSARALVASGVQRGDRVAIWAPNISEWALAALGTHRAGGVVVPLNTRFKGHEAGHVLRTAEVRTLFTVNGFLDTEYTSMLRDAGDLPLLEEVIVLRGDVPDGCTSWADHLSRAADVDPSVTSERAAAVEADDLCDILFTSGTTGAPKGAMLRHGASVRAYEDWSTVVGLREGDRYLVVNPFFHAFGLKAGILASLLKGATIVPQPVFDVNQVMQRVVEERITMLPGPPAVFQSILDHPELDRFDMSSLRLTVTGAAVVPLELVMRMRAELAFETIVTGYGLTEATGIVTMCRHDDDPEIIANTAGRPIPGVEVHVVDDDGKEVGVGQPGEVVVRGYNVMKGFYGDPEATAAAIDEDGWLHTGDVGVFDEGGNLKITDRKKDMFIVGGFNAYPAEIENLMLANEAISQVAVIGIPDRRMGEVAMAFVVPRPGASIEPESLIEWCRERMANYKVPRRIEVVDALPMNASNKVTKFELRQRAGSLVEKG